MNRKRRKKQELISHKELSKKFLMQMGKTIQKFFSGLNNWISSITDPRVKNKCDYKLKEIFWISLLMLMTPVKSRNNYKEEMRFIEVMEVINKLFKVELTSMPHGDTLANVWKRLSVEEIERIRTLMIRKLIKGRHLENFRFKKTYLIAFDGVEVYRWHEKHCDNCLYSVINGKKQYYHRVLEAKLVCSNGFSFSIASEFIENSNDREDNKQDCELKAFHRLAEKVKKLFPRLPITILGDGLYPNGPVFQRCKEYGWNYILVLKDEVLRSVWKDFHGLFKMTKTAIGAKLKLPEFIRDNRRYRWQNDLLYSGEKFDDSINLLEIGEKNKTKWKTARAFITNWKLNKKIVLKLEQAGQMRWKIENQGFDIQKHHGYYLEHIYCEDPNAMKIVYLFIQIAHLINQLFIKADLLNLASSLTLEACLKRFLDGLRLGWSSILEELWISTQQMNIQARFRPP